ncbi:MAG: metallophosphoesterase [Nanoarchaeota archaeon]
MKFLTFTDLHEDKVVLKELVKRAAQPDIDFIVCCGDISTFGRGLTLVFKSFEAVKKPFYVIPGNHEEGEILTKALTGFSNCHNFDRQAIKIEGYVFLGYGGGGFSVQDETFRKLARQWYGKYKEEKVILVTHGPPFGTALDLMGQKHVGNKDFRQFIDRIKPKIAISGHLHEAVGKMDTLGKTKLINPGWEGMVVELK